MTPAHITCASDVRRPPIKRGVNTVDDLRERSGRDPVTLCWHWKFSTSNGRPAMWTFDYDRGEKRVLSGPRGVWFIAHGTPLGNRIAYMRCFTSDCVCPVHVAYASTRAELNSALGRSGKLDGHHEARRRGLEAAWAARHKQWTPPDVIAEVRRLSGTMSASAISRELGISKSTACRIVAGTIYTGVTA